MDENSTVEPQRIVEFRRHSTSVAVPPRGSHPDHVLHILIDGLSLQVFVDPRALLVSMSGICGGIHFKGPPLGRSRRGTGRCDSGMEERRSRRADLGHHGPPDGEHETRLATSLFEEPRSEVRNRPWHVGICWIVRLSAGRDGCPCVASLESNDATQRLLSFAEDGINPVPGCVAPAVILAKAQSNGAMPFSKGEKPEGGSSIKLIKSQIPTTQDHYALYEWLRT